MSVNQRRGIALNLTAQIVTAYVGCNDTETGSLPNIVRSILNTILELQAADTLAGVEVDDRSHPHHQSASDIANEGFVVCLEDGLKMKVLKRHLLTAHGLTPAQYREKWALPDDHPMVATDYRKYRSVLAKESGLGLNPFKRPDGVGAVRR